MTRPGRSLLLRLFFVLIAAIFLGSIFLVYTVRRSFPQTSGEIRIQQLNAPVEVKRDRLGIPHIYASTTHDLFLAQGYVHAQDRFWQMDVWRHTGSGRLAEMFGHPLLKTDQFLRTMGWARVTSREMETLDPVSIGMLRDYTSGVNAYLKEHSGGGVSLEYPVLRLANSGYQIEEWQPLHSLSWGKAMAWDLCENMGFEIDRAVLLKNLTPAQIDELYPEYPTDHPFILPAATQTVGAHGMRPSPAVEIPATGLKPLQVTSQKIGNLNSFLDSKGDAIGSNNWVISGKRTSTGKPILSNDPHLSTQMPSIWYQIGLHCRPRGPQCPFDVAGFSFAGVPGVVIGHNDRIAWGFTNVGPDVQDLYIERLNPDNPNQYEVNGKWVQMNLVNETIRVSDGSTVPLTVRYTRHGPVISDTYEELKDFRQKTGLQVPEQYAISFRWTALDPCDTFPAIWKMNLAQNWTEFREAAAAFDVPSQNIVYADVDGNIGYQLPGKIPIRANGDGRYPVPGWTDEFEWTGYIPFEQLPSDFNPARGYVASANNAVTTSSYPYFISRDWDYGFRAQRIVEMIEQRGPGVSVDDLHRMQGDNKNLNAETLVPLLLKLPMNEARLKKVRSLLINWDFQEEMNSAQAALFETFWKHLLAVTFHDDLPADFWPGGGNRWNEIARRLLSQPDSKWWDNRATSAIESRDQMFQRAFAGAVKELEQSLGSNTSKWQWGALHTTTFRNGTLGKSGNRFIEWLFNRGPFPTSGGTALVNATAWNAARSYQVTSLPSMRMIVDLSDLNNSVVVNTTGQSGHAFHPHYIDQANLWRQIKYSPMLWDEMRIRNDSVETLRLIPH